MSKKAFTLEELLVVIAIIAVLMAILMPVLGRAREQGRSVVCRANLRQIAFAGHMWSEDNDGWVNPCSWSWPDPMQVQKYPEETNPGSLKPYVASDRLEKKNIFACPSARNRRFLNPGEKGMGENDQCTYCINGWMTLYTYDELGDKGPGDPAEGPSWAGPDWIYWKYHGNTKLMNVRRPHDTVYFMDHEYYLAAPWTFDPFTDPIMLGREFISLTRWHDKKPDAWYGKANMAWVDGHVSVEPRDIDELPKNAGDEAPWKYYFYNH
jgi:prepilin-type N-terminal cleavage/methylation domain-containing protein/prepilin-type processing-associated H-X9-DG protein